MSDTGLLVMFAALFSAGLQIVKDKLKFNPATLRYVGIGLGAIAGGVVVWARGIDSANSIIGLLVAGAIATTGTHSALLQGSLLGKILKSIGEAVFTSASADKPST